MNFIDIQLYITGPGLFRWWPMPHHQSKNVNIAINMTNTQWTKAAPPLTDMSKSHFMTVV
jgi:hypothetical protein